MKKVCVLMALLLIAGIAAYGAEPASGCDASYNCNRQPTSAIESTSLSTSSLTTTFAGGNCQDGNMFDVKALNSITITGFALNLEFTGTVEVYYKVGTWVGFDTNASAWTKLGSQYVTGAGLGVPTTLSVGGLTIPAGQTYGLYITATSHSSCSMQYTNGTTDYQNTDLIIYHGAGKSYPFGATFTPRIWNGTIYYQPASLYDMSFKDDYGRSSVCVNSKTGDWQYSVLSGLGRGIYKGKGSVTKMGAWWSFRSAAGSPVLFLLTYYPTMSLASGSLGGSSFISNLYDKNTKDDALLCGP